MKKILLVLIMFSAATLVHAQLANTKWKTVVNIDGPVNVIFDFKKDTLSLYTVSDSTVIETMTYTSDGSSITIVKVDGQSDCDDAPAKYRFRLEKNFLYLKMIADDCDDRSNVIDTTRWIRLKVPVEVKVNETILKQYAGVYQADASHPITVTYENGKLYAEGPNNNLPKSPLIPESNTKFFIKIAAIEWDFVKDAKGKVIKLISHEEKDYELKKVK
jgi:hypothetical protein